MIRVAAITSGRNRPSTRFRVRQHISVLAELGIEVDEYIPAIDKYQRIPGFGDRPLRGATRPLLLPWLALKLSMRLPGILGSWSHQVSWLQREMLPGLPSLENLLKKPLVLDCDDATWLHPPWGKATLRRLARMASVVVAGNRHLADWFSDFCDDVRILPTAIDTERFTPSPLSRRSDVFTIGWTGLSSNFHFLQTIREPLLMFLEKHKDVRLVVMADAKPGFLEIGEGCSVEFIPWSREAEVRMVQGLDVGLMPLPDHPFARGKCSFKMLQYMACEVPAIVSPIGMNAEILDLDEVGLAATSNADWYEAIETLYRDRRFAQGLGRRGRKLAQHRFDRRYISEQLAELFRQLV